jgi:putative membrane protein
MRSYNPKDWKQFIFHFYQTDTLRKLLPLLIVVGLYSFGVAFIEMNYVTAEQKEHVRNISVMHTLLGFAISMLLVFRTNTAYDRWWEGRKLWGALVNNSRNLAIKLDTLLDKDDKHTRTFFAELISRFAMELKNHLQLKGVQYELDEFDHPEIPQFKKLNHVPNQLAAALMNKVVQMQNNKQILPEQLLFINSEVSSFIDICGACERIKNTPIPFSYSSFIKIFILLYTFTLPIGYVFSLGYFIVPVVMVVFYALASLEVIAEEIEDPFGHDDNDLPMQKIAENIKRNVTEILS